jgi:hypothetical protein
MVSVMRQIKIVAYAAVTYLVIRTASSTYVRFLASKTRVAPIDKQTISRLELLSCLILARLLKDVEEALRQELQLQDSFCWTDSKVALFCSGSRTKMGSGNSSCRTEQWKSEIW